LEHQEADMRRLEQRFKVAAILFGSLCLMSVAGLGYYVSHSGQNGVKAAAATAHTSERTPPAQQLGMLVIWASMAVTDW
jgi:hypothetical protein